MIIMGNLTRSVKQGVVCYISDLLYILRLGSDDTLILNCQTLYILVMLNLLLVTQLSVLSWYLSFPFPQILKINQAVFLLPLLVFFTELNADP